MLSAVAIVLIVVVVVGITVVGLAAVITSGRRRRFDEARERSVMLREAADRAGHAGGLAREPIDRLVAADPQAPVADGRWARGQRVRAR